MKKNIQVLLQAVIVLVLLSGATAFAQYQPIWDDSLYTYVGVRIDKGPEQLEADLSEVVVPVAGKYIIWANMVHDSGDEQLNESYYITAVHEDGTVVTPLDPNAGPYKVISDYPGLTTDPIFENAGRFNLKTGKYTLRMHHYYLIYEQYPQFLNGIMGGEHGEAESLYIQDSLFVIADPDVDGLMNVQAWTRHEELINNRQTKTAYAGEMVTVRFKAENNFINDIRFAKMYGTLPDSMQNLVFSIQPDDTLDEQFVWNVPRLAPDDSFSVWVTGNVTETLPEGLLFQNAVGRLTVNSDIDTTNNIDGDHYWVHTAPAAVADMGLQIYAQTDSSRLFGQDTLKYARRSEQIPFIISTANLLSDSAQNVRVVTKLPSELTFLSSDLPVTRMQPDGPEWDLGTVNPNSQQSWTIQTRVRADVPDSVTVLETSATIIASNDTIPDNNSDKDIVLLYSKENHSDLSVIIEATTDTSIQFNNQTEKAVLAGDSYAFQIQVTNNGPDSTFSSMLNALLPDSVNITYFSLPPIRTSSDSLVWMLGPMRPDSVLIIDLTAETFPHFSQSPFLLTHVARIENDTDLNLSNNLDTDQVYAINPEVRVDLAMDVNIVSDTTIQFNNQLEKAVLAGDAYQVDLLVSNAGPAAAQSYEFWTLLPDSVSVTGYSVQPTATEGDTLFWQRSALASGTSFSVSMTVQTVSEFPVELFKLTHSATVKTDQPDTNPGNNSDSEYLYAIKPLEPIVTDMSVSVRTLSDTSVTIGSVEHNAVVGGDSYRFFMDIGNGGSNTANTSTLTTTIPDSVTVLGYSLLPTNVNGNNARWVLGPVAPDSTFSIQMELLSKRDFTDYPFKLNHPAEITSINDVNDSNNQDQTDIYVLEPSDTSKVDIWAEIISTTEKNTVIEGKTYNMVYPGDSLEYTINIGNLGPDPAVDVTLELSVPVYISLFNFSTAPQNHDGRLTWTFSQMDVNQQSHITFRAMLAEGTEAREWIPTSVQSWLAQQDVNPANNADVDTVRIEPEPDPLKNFDARIAFTVQSDSSLVLNNTTWPAVVAGDKYTYHLTVTNDGPLTGHDIVVSADVPDNISLTNFSKPSEFDDALIWTLDSLGMGDTWLVSFDATSPINLSGFPYPVHSTASLSAANDTVAANNSAENTIYILEKEIIDVTPVLTAETDSTGQVDGVTYAFARESEQYTYNVTVSNIGNRDAMSGTIVVAYPMAASLIGVAASNYPHTTDGNSITWTFSSLAAGTNISLSFDVKVLQFMPVGINDLDASVQVSADNESSDKTDNNRDDLTVKNYVKQPEPFTPEITVLPSIIDVTDSAKVSVKVPVNIVKWDIQIYAPTGEIITDYADDYIDNNLLQPGVWYEIDDWYDQDYLYSGTQSDNLVFEITAWDARGTEGKAQAPLVIRSANHMVLDRNVFKPGLEDYVDIKFKLSYERLARLDVWDVSGRLITTLTEDIYNGGWNSYLWNGRLQDGRAAGSGVYLITLDAGDFKDWKKLIIVR